jgi:hypothetical protein
LGGLARRDWRPYLPAMRRAAYILTLIGIWAASMAALDFVTATAVGAKIAGEMLATVDQKLALCLRELGGTE